MRTRRHLPARAANQRPYRSVTVEAELDEPLSRWLWLVKPVLLVPHHIALTALWLLFVAASAIAFIAILFTGRYPRVLFAFTTGVLRWTWRVAYYFSGTLATDRYPPFSLGAVPGYPARVEIAYPERLSRGLVLVKSWLLPLPHFLLLGLSALVFLAAQWWGGLLWLLVVCAVVVSCFLGPAAILLFTGHYPRRLFGPIVGFGRWILRLLAYVALMTDEYPPLRIDAGGTEPAVPRTPASG
ncbi:hypothetical protein AV521_40385 [Streptomyces sp. IMTB 2501]|uniref:DUF4389 domain-containing protein n=1 Tax=Streptomyces sp. IMTB 2501 TaxID=1776340 RepID=UPI00096DEFC2|nr:DUF4389 domain-containing protein [Streptomyces sp. IMTB 2501]OLZ62873.1 hypothetical protein AV521_40385 [Streptomyces sp. IMTB 2501]